MAASRTAAPTDLPERLRIFLSRHVAPQATLWVALSGGLDSVVLLHLAAVVWPRAQLAAIHVHHGLSPYADDWAAFCQADCAALAIPLCVDRVSVARHSPSGLEAAARQARYQAYRDCGAKTLLLAHHADDQAETLLFNLIRGAGVRGAAAMPARRERQGQCFLRPLLDVPRSHLRAWAEARALTWIEDESNTDERFSRNYLRHSVMPVINARFAGASERLAEAAGRFAEAEALLTALAEQDWASLAVEGRLPVKALRPLDQARLRNLIRYRLRYLGWQAPVDRRLEEFARQLQAAGPDRHPALALPDGEMRVFQGCLGWFPHAIPCNA